MKRLLLLGLTGMMLAIAAGLTFDPGMSVASAHPVPLVPAFGAHVAPAAPADTVRHRVTAGEPLIMALPGTLSDRPVTAYRLLRAPALSWLVDRSLLWRTRPDDVGTHALLVHATFSEAHSDTLTILVNVTE